MRTVIQLYLEMTPDQGGVAHVPEIPGCHFRGADRMELVARASKEVSRYLDWCGTHGLSDLDPQVAALIKARRKATAASGPALVVRVAEERMGEPIWMPGSPCVLFDWDRETLDDAGVHAHFRVARAAYEEVARKLASLDPEELAAESTPGDRSIAEELEEVASTMWWYCSRLSDELPEPGSECPPAGLARIQWLIPYAESWFLSIPQDRRAEVVVPARFPTRDPAECWTARKACRRQAEHIVEHLTALSRREP